MSTALVQFEERFEALKKTGLSDMKFYPGEVSEATSEEFAQEALEMLDAIKKGSVQPIELGDSQKK